MLRQHAYLVSMYSGTDSKFRKRLTPQKMWPLKGDKTKRRLSKEEVQAIFDRSNRRRGITNGKSS